MKPVPIIVLLCSFSNDKLRKHLHFSMFYWGNIIRRLLRMPFDTDFAVWDTYAIAELEKLNEFEIHVVAPHSGVARLQEFKENGIYYHIFWSEWDIIIEKIKRRFNLRTEKAFPRNRKTISRLIRKIQPDIVHVIGIENKFHSMAVLDIPTSIPVIAQLQTLISDKRFKDNCRSTEKAYQYDSQIEQIILNRADFIGTDVKCFRKIIVDNIKPNAIFLDMALPLTEKIRKEETNKLYDFVYFAADISKAADWAIEAFALTNKKHPEVKLNIVGGYSKDYKNEIDKRIAELNLASNISFEGKLPTHEDVIAQIRKSRFAILPLKIDLISGTVREAMANGIPVVTTETPATPKLNERFQSVLIAPNGDFQAMSELMCELIENPSFAAKISENGLNISAARKSNEEIIAGWVRSYFEILDQ